MPLEIKPAYDAIDHIRALFNEYIQMLSLMESDFQTYLTIQNYDQEITDPNEKYSPPDGRLYIALYDGAPAGCIALRRLGETDCEMKRLYIRPQFRGKGIAKALTALVIHDARKIGYHAMLLDTLPALKDAVRLYEKAGFYTIPAYNDSPVSKTIFMKLDL